METDFQMTFEVLSGFIKSILNSQPFFIFKILIGIYVGILFLDIVMLLALRDVGWHYRTGMRGMDIPLTSKRKMARRWKAIKDRLKTENPSQYKVAIIEADTIAEELLSGIGYKGENMNEKLEQVGENHLDGHLEELKNAHLVRNRIVYEEGFALDKKMTESVLDVYENFIRYLDYL